jgi:hypothetical protein
MGCVQKKFLGKFRVGGGEARRINIAANGRFARGYFRKFSKKLISRQICNSLKRLPLVTVVNQGKALS